METQSTKSAQPSETSRAYMHWFFGFFFVSGFCSILYEIVWLRLSMAKFGVTTALTSIVLSMFMAGLGLGSWGSGLLIRKYEGRINVSAVRLYAVLELLIGFSSVLVPLQLQWGRDLLERITLSSSASYYLASGFWIALTLIPWCACMGATIPVAMLAIRNSSHKAQRSFSHLYLANVLGAVAGATVPLILIELYGFHGTLKIGAALNALLAIAAAFLRIEHFADKRNRSSEAANTAVTFQPSRNRSTLWLLFGTGLTSMGLEVVWIRQFTPYLGTVVYAFAAILAIYLLFTFIGSSLYRRWSRNHQQESTLLWVALGLCALLPLLTANPAFHLGRMWRLILGIGPFSALLGFVTPMLVDHRSGGDPDAAGRAYAVNVVGCILGPLLSGFLLLPLLSERWVLVVFALPWLVIGVLPASYGPETTPKNAWQTALSYTALALAVGLAISNKGYYDSAPGPVLRDNTATVIATGQGMQKQLLVNGIGLTVLTPVTKMMAHLPLAFLDHAPHNALVVCFGMGTTYRSLLSWGIPTTAVELVPSVPRLFSYYHADGPQLMQSPLSRVVIDDGRRYLERTPEQFDVITLDPPPPVEAAASSLLYSKEFYIAVKRRLRPDGILQQWLPAGDTVTQASVARALQESFPHVRVFRSVEHWGLHFLASNRPIPNRTAEELVRHMPANATDDLMEWGPQPTAEKQFAVVLDSELTLDQIIAQAPQAPALQDDRPMNEYYALRHNWLKPERWYLIW